MNKEIEEKVVSAFVLKRKKERVLYELFSEKKRDGLLFSLGVGGHSPIDSKYAFKIQQPLPTFEEVYKILKNHGAPETCYVLGGRTIDGEEVLLSNALKDVFGWGGALISCIHGKLAYLEGHLEIGAPNRYVLKRY